MTAARKKFLVFQSYLSKLATCACNHVFGTSYARIEDYIQIQNNQRRPVGCVQTTYGTHTSCGMCAFVYSLQWNLCTPRDVYKSPMGRRYLAGCVLFSVNYSEKLVPHGMFAKSNRKIWPHLSVSHNDRGDRDNQREVSGLLYTLCTSWVRHITAHTSASIFPISIVWITATLLRLLVVML